MLRRFLNTFVSQKEEASVSPPKQSETQVQLSELRYRRLFETAQVGILILDAPSGKITGANPFLKDLMGYSDAQLLEKKLWKTGIFKDFVDSKKAFRQLQTQGYAHYMDLPLKTKDGRPINVDFISKVYMVGNQEVVQCNIRDVTSRKRAEEAVKVRTQELENLALSQEETKKALLNVMEDLEEAKAIIEIEKVRNEAILASIGDAVAACDRNGKVILFNNIAEKLTGFSSKEVIDKHYSKSFKFVMEGSGRPSKDFIAKAMSNNIITKMINPVLIVRKDGKKIPVADSAAPVIDTKGNVIGCVVVFRDVTQEREIDRMKTEFVSITSHELRTPLTAIDGLVSMILGGEYGPVSENLKKPLKDVNDSSERLIHLVNDLLSLSRLQSGRLRYNLSEFLLSKEIGNIVKLLQPIAAKKNLMLSLTSIPNISIQADKDMFRQIMDNIIGNALKFTDKGSISVSAKKAGKNELVEISIIDTGIGIGKEDQKKLFGKFEQINPNGNRPAGTGLGLYLSREVVHKMGGEFWLERSEKGKGSTFVFSLPKSKSQLAQKVKKEIESETKLSPYQKSNNVISGK